MRKALHQQQAYVVCSPMSSPIPHPHHLVPPLDTIEAVT